MNSKLTTDFLKPTKFTAENYGTKISVEIDHSDLDIDEVMDAFQTLIIGMGYHQDSFKRWVIDRADEYNETDAEDLKQKLEAWKFDMDNDIVLSHNTPKVNEEEEDEFFGKYTTKCYCGHTDKCDCGPEDYKGQFKDWENETPDNKDRYRATDEDEAEFDDYGQRIHPTFEWGDEPEDSWFDEEEYKPNEALKEAKKKYDKALKTLSKKRKPKSVKDIEDEFDLGGNE